VLHAQTLAKQQQLLFLRKQMVQAARKAEYDHALQLT
jgi:hypothetical protein